MFVLIKKKLNSEAIKLESDIISAELPSISMLLFTSGPKCGIISHTSQQQILFRGKRGVELDYD